MRIGLVLLGAVLVLFAGLVMLVVLGTGGLWALYVVGPGVTIAVGVALVLAAIAFIWSAFVEEPGRKTRSVAPQASRTVHWPRFDPNQPGDLERAVKEARRLMKAQHSGSAPDQDATPRR
jgi:hypothetical protein